MLRSPRHRPGFSLPELLIALAMIGILSAITGPRIGEALRRHALEGAAQQLALDMKRAQSEAVKRNRNVSLTRVGLTGYSVDGGPATVFADQVTFTTASPATVTFASFGPPTTGSATMTLRRGTASKTVRVSATGRVSVQ